MKLLNTSYIEIKKSKFYVYLYELDSIEDVKPYAYYFNNTAGKSDDKEPGNISISFLNNLERNNLNNHLIAVVRFYGGTKLGASNLSRTYGKCASTCINK